MGGGAGVDRAPALETERLRLREHRRDDFAACTAMWADPAVVRFIGGVPSTPQRTWMRMLAYAGHWRLMGYGYWALEEKSTGRFVGELGFANFEREIEASMRGVPEIGWALAPEFHGRGLALESVRSIVAWGDVYLPTLRTVCLIDAGNLASLRIAAAMGFIVLAASGDAKGALVRLERPRTAAPVPRAVRDD